MLLVSVLLAITWRISNCHSDLSDSAEIKAMELNPFYDTIIFNDIADIMNDMEVKFGGPQFETTIKNESQEEDDEDVLDLLSEYQHYLDRAHKQIKTYFEKSKTKNKVPLLRKDKFTKSKTMPSNIYDRQTSFYMGKHNPIDFFVPINPNLSFLHSPELTPSQSKATQELYNLQKLMDDISKPPNMPFYIDEGIKSCSCKNSEDCKKCLMPLGRISVNNNGGFEKPAQESNIFLGTDDLAIDRKPDDSLNIRVKVDIEMPKLFDIFGKLMKNFTREKVSDNSGSLFKHGIYNPAYDFPFAMHMYGGPQNTKINQYDVTPLRSLTLHKKKKQRPSISKKHKKKLITFHNYKLEPQRSLKTIFIQNFNISDNLTVENKTNTLGNGVGNNTLSAVNATQDYNRIVESNSTDRNYNMTNFETQTAESIFLTVNISNNVDNLTNEGRIVNSIETETVNLTTSRPNSLRKKRDTTSSNDTSHDNHNVTVTHDNKNTSQVNDSKEARATPKKEKELSLLDSELLYWPVKTNETAPGLHNNITTIILEKENSKAKLNISNDFLKTNRTEALQQAIFGDVDWNDVDAVAPAFLSFVGKYVDGILTFCSQKTCHSMKCAEKSCIHRICTPDQRINGKGHCIGSNNTESVVSMESVMDLPSSVPFKVVDILENKMLGRLFGKATVCMGNKCLTFMASKKNFMKSKCSSKELNLTGHCSCAKNTKLV